MSFPDIWAVVPVLCMKERTKKNNGKPALLIIPIIEVGKSNSIKHLKGQTILPN